LYYRSRSNRNNNNNNSSSSSSSIKSSRFKPLPRQGVREVRTQDTRSSTVVPLISNTIRTIITRTIIRRRQARRVAGPLPPHRRLRLLPRPTSTIHTTTHLRHRLLLRRDCTLLRIRIRIRTRTRTSHLSTLRCLPRRFLRSVAARSCHTLLRIPTLINWTGERCRPLNLLSGLFPHSLAPSSRTAQCPAPAPPRQPRSLRYHPRRPPRAHRCRHRPRWQLLMAAAAATTVELKRPLRRRGPITMEEPQLGTAAAASGRAHPRLVSLVVERQEAGEGRK
jgi:hypothetical protein